MWMFNRTFGVGGLVRFSRASVDLDAPAPHDLGRRRQRLCRRGNTAALLSDGLKVSDA